MEQVAPCGGVYQAGTLSGNPVAMAAGLAQLRYLQEHPEVYAQIDGYAERLASGMREIAARAGVSAAVNQTASLLSPFFAAGTVGSFAAAKGSDLDRYASYFAGMLQNGVALAPAQFEAMFVSAAHGEEELEKTLGAFERVVRSFC